MKVKPRSCTNKMLIYTLVNFALCLFQSFSIRVTLYKGSCCAIIIAWPISRRTKGNISGNKRRPECKTTHISVAVSESHGGQTQQDQNLHSEICVCVRATCKWSNSWQTFQLKRLFYAKTIYSTMAFRAFVAITSNNRKTGVNRVRIWIFEWAIVNRF